MRLFNFPRPSFSVSLLLLFDGGTLAAACQTPFAFAKTLSKIVSLRLATNKKKKKVGEEEKTDGDGVL